MLYIASTLTNENPEIGRRYWHQILQGVFQPLQGCWHFFAFVRPKVATIQRRQNENNISFISAVKKIILDYERPSYERRANRRHGIINLGEIPIEEDTPSDDISFEDVISLSTDNSSRSVDIL